MGDLPKGPGLLALARTVLSEELTPLLPPERQGDARLVAAILAIAERAAAAGDAPFQAILRELAAFYEGFACPSSARESALAHPALRAGSPLSRNAGEGAGRSEAGEGKADALPLLRRFADDLRRGAFEASPGREVAAHVLMRNLTIARLRIENPQFLAANGVL